MILLWYTINILNDLNIQEPERINELKRQSKEKFKAEQHINFLLFKFLNHILIFETETLINVTN